MAAIMTLLAIHHFTYYSGDTQDYPLISFSILISRQNTRATLNMFQCEKMPWKMPINLLPRNLRKVEPGLRNIMTWSYAVLSYSPMIMSWYITYHNGVALGSYKHTRKTKYTVLSCKEALTHLYTRLNLRQARPYMRTSVKFTSTMWFSSFRLWPSTSSAFSKAGAWKGSIKETKTTQMSVASTFKISSSARACRWKK